MTLNNVNINCTVVETTADKDGVWVKASVPNKKPFNILVFFSNEKPIPAMARNDKLLVNGFIASMDGQSFHIRSYFTMKVSEF